jgi:hypothetical protein
MKRIIKIAAVSTAAAIVLALSITSVAMAAGPNNPGTCPNPDCTKVCPNPDGTNVCPNPDCTGGGDQLQTQYRNGRQDTKDGARQYRYRSCQTE